MLDDELVIETPERVELHYALASVGNRFLAAGIDHLIQITAIVIILVAAGALSDWQLFSGMGVWTAALTVLALFTIYWGYPVERPDPRQENHATPRCARGRQAGEVLRGLC